MELPMKNPLIQLTVLLLGLLLALPGPAPAQGNGPLAAQINAGYDLLEQGKFDQARKVYEDFLKQHPGNPLALNNLAAILTKKGDFQQALALLNQALPHAKGYKITLNRVCNVEGVCAAYRQSTDGFGQENLEDLIKSNILMVNMAASGRSR